MSITALLTGIGAGVAIGGAFNALTETDPAWRRAAWAAARTGLVLTLTGLAAAALERIL